MRIEFLGTCSAIPTKQRNVSSLVLTLDDGRQYLVDCGEGTQQQMLHAVSRLGKIDRIFVTHMHGDHTFGLPGLLCSLGMVANSAAANEEQIVEDEEQSCSSSIAADSSGEEAPSSILLKQNARILDVYGPLGLAQYIRWSLMLTDSYLPYLYRVHELIPPLHWEESSSMSIKVGEELPERLHPCELAGSKISGLNGEWLLFEDEFLSVRAGCVRHRVPSFGYVFEEHPFPGKLDMNRCIELGVPKGPLLGQLKNGSSVCLPDGRIVSPEDVVGPPIPGRKIAILGDSCDSTPMRDLCMKSTVLVHECTFEKSQKGMAIEKGHSTTEMAGQFASDCQVSQLLLNHFSAKYTGSSAEKEVERLKQEVIEAFSEGTVTMGADLSIIQIAKPKLS